MWAALPGLFLGRLANFVNGELPGEPLGLAGQVAEPWWSVQYPGELVSLIHQLTQIQISF